MTLPNAATVHDRVPSRQETADRKEDPAVFLMVQTLETGGSERQFAALAKSLPQSAFRLELGCIRRKGTLNDFGEIPQFPLGGSLFGMQSLKSRFALARHLRRRRISISQSFDFYSNLTAIPAARMAGVPVVIGSQRQLGDQLRPAQSRAQLVAFRCCDKVVCNSQAGAEGLIKRGFPAHRIAVIGNGLLPEAFAAAKPALPFRPGVVRVGMIARMNARYKNHDHFLLATARLQHRFPNAEFILVGDGPLRPELEEKARSLGLEKRVIFLGDRRDIPAILASLEFTALPSATESLSNAILESMAAGVPVVAYQIGGNPELITKHTGLLVRPNDVEAFAEAMGGLLNGASQRAELGRNARAFAQTNFNMDKVRGRYEELYRDLLQQKVGYRKPR